MVRFNIPSANGHDVEVFHKLSDAEKRFAELTESGKRAAVPSGKEGESKLVTHLPPDAEDVTFFGPLVGG